MARTWTNQTGFPVVTLTPGADGCSCSLSQKRFFANSELKDSANSAWDIPLTCVTSSNPSEVSKIGIWSAKDATKQDEALVADTSITMAIPAPSEDDGWIKLNADQTGFYLVNYTSTGWKALKKPIEELELNVLDRVSLLNGIFMLSRSGLLSCAEALDFSSAFKSEPEYLCWKELSENIRIYCALFSNEATYPLLQRYIQALFHGVMQRLTWDKLPSDVETTGFFRSDVILMLGLTNDEDTVKEALSRFNNYMTDAANSNLSADLRSVVFSIQARHGSRAEFTKLQTLYEQSDFIEEKLNCLSAIGKFPSEQLKREAIEWGLRAVRSQDIAYVFASVASNSVGAQFAWKYVQENWGALNGKYAPYIVGRIVCASIARYQSEDDAAAIEYFLSTRKHPSYERPLESTLERIRNRATCYTRDLKDMNQWLQALTF